MAPAILGRQTSATPAATQEPPLSPTDALGGTPGNTQNPAPINTTTILIVVVVICASVIMSAALFYIFDRKKNSQFREACKRDPYLTRKEFARRRKLSALERLEEEEMQRSVMIRKSLASRTPSSRTYSSLLSNGSSDDDECDLGMQGINHREVPEMQERSPRGEWGPRSDSGSDSGSLSGASARRYTEPHPGVEVELPLPPSPRTPSPTRMPTRKPVPPPVVRTNTR